MPDPTGYAVPSSINTDFRDFNKSPLHLMGNRVKRQPTPLSFSDVYTATGKVVIRDDLFDGTVKVPCALKIHNPGQVISSFVTNSNYAQAIANGVYYNVVMNGVMHGYSSGPFISGTIRYNTWRLRGKDDSGWHVFAGSSVHDDGVNLTGMYVLAGPIFVLSPDFVVGLSDGDIHWQLEVGFGGAANALATTTVEAATAEWPAFGG